MYKRKFDQAGVYPDDLKPLGDPARFPYTTKQDLRDNYPFDTFSVPMEQVVRIHASSGITGRPTVVGHTQRDIDNWADIVTRCLRAGGATAKDKVHIAYGYDLFTGGLGTHYVAERLGTTVIPMSGGQTERQAQLILDFKPDIIMVTPSYCLRLSDELERKMGGDARGCSLRCKHTCFSSTHFVRFPVFQPSAGTLPASGCSGIHEAARCYIPSASAR